MLKEEKRDIREIIRFSDDIQRYAVLEFLNNDFQVCTYHSPNTVYDLRDWYFMEEIAKKIKEEIANRKK